MKPNNYEKFLFEEQDFLLRHFDAAQNKALAKSGKVTKSALLKIILQVWSLYEVNAALKRWSKKEYTEVYKFLTTADSSYINHIVTAFKSQTKIA
jgi:5-methylthioribose kinase